MRRSFIVTGASATGKTTLVDLAVNYGYVFLPMHITRPIRHGEIPGVHGEFLTQDDFRRRFALGEYYEPSVVYAEKFGNYYGTPRAWSQKLSRDGFCASPTTPLIARRIQETVDVLWVCLVCNRDMRRLRLLERNIDPEETEARLDADDIHRDISKNTLVIDTSIISPIQALCQICGSSL